MPRSADRFRVTSDDPSLDALVALRRTSAMSFFFSKAHFDKICVCVFSRWCNLCGRAWCSCKVGGLSPCVVSWCLNSAKQNGSLYLQPTPIVRYKQIRHCRRKSSSLGVSTHQHPSTFTLICTVPATNIRCNRRLSPESTTPTATASEAIVRCFIP